MELRIDSKLEANHNSYRVMIRSASVDFEKILEGRIRRKGFECSTSHLEEVLKRQTLLSIAEFSESVLTDSEETWEQLFAAAMAKQTCRWVKDETQHEPAYPGFVDCWKLTSCGQNVIRLNASIFDHHDSNYHNDSCSHEFRASAAIDVLKNVGANSYSHLMELAEEFDDSDWKKMHDSIPSARECKWLFKWRG